MITSTPLRALRALKSLVPTAALAALLSAATANAQVTSISETQLTALNPTAVPITGPVRQSYSPTYTTSAMIPTGGTLTLIMSNGPAPPAGKALLRRNQQGGGDPNANFGGDFLPDTPLIANTVGVNTTGSADGLRINFSTPVSAFGFNFDPDAGFAGTDFTLVVFEGLTQTTFSNGTLTNAASTAQNDGTAPFFGIQDAGGNAITSILLSGAAAANPSPGSSFNNRPNDFAVGLLRFNITATVPEPGNIALLLGMTVTGAGYFSRRKRAAI